MSIQDKHRASERREDGVTVRTRGPVGTQVEMGEDTGGIDPRGGLRPAGTGKQPEWELKWVWGGGAGDLLWLCPRRHD